MRNKYYLLICIFLITSIQISAQYTSIPDANFEAALDALGYDDISGDGQVPTSNIEVITSLELNNQNISDLTGINDFVALETLKLQYNNLTSLDVSNLINLRILWASNGNIFSSIDVSNNTSLEDFRIRQYTGTSIDLSSLTLLNRFSCTSCDLTSLDTSNNPNLSYLDLWNSDINTLDLSMNTNLATLDVYSTKLVSLDLSKNTSLISLTANDISTLTSLNVQNGNNTNVTKFQISSNPGLTCINVDDTAYSTTNWTNIDTGMYFSTYNCRYTQIPDANFETRLFALGYDDIANDGQVPTDLIEVVTELQLAGQNITDLTGIEDFTALEELKANGNNITSIDLSNNTALKLFQMTSSSSLGSINVSNNPVLADIQIQSLNSSIDISNLSALDRFACVGCTFTTLNTSGNPNLRHLDLEDTPVTTLDLSTNTKLEILELENTSLVALDLSKNTSFRYLYAQDITTLTTLNIKNGNNTNINAFDIIGTPILCVLVDDLAYSTTNWTNIESTTRFSETNCNYTTIPDATFEATLEALGYDNISGDGKVPTFLIESLTILNISNKGITDLTGIEDFTALEELKANQNDLTSINLTNNTALKVLWIRQGNNNFSSIDVSKNLALEDFRIQYSGTSLDISNNTALTQFMCTDCSLTTLDTSANTNLTSLDLEGSDITTLDLSTNINLTGLEIDSTNLVELDLSNNTALKYLLAENNTTLTSLNIKNGANTNIITFETVGSPVPCILVDDVTYSTSNWTDIDVASSFNQLYCDYTTIPDANFEAELESLGYDDISGDGQVPTSFIENITSLSVANKNISDLTGIEDFTALETLSCQSNSLTTLNVSFNKELIELTANANNITSIDLSKNTKLEKLIIGANELTSIDVSNNTLLQRLDILYNDITDLNISNNPNLTSLNAYNTDIASYDFSNNPLLKNVQLYNNNNLTSLNVSNLTVLDQLQVHNTGISSLDLTNNIDLRILRASSTNITALDLSHQSKLIQLYANNTDIMYLNVRNGNNTNVTQFHADNTPNLSCVIVDDSNYSTTNWTNIDSGMTFSESYCEYTTVADANFEAALNTLGYDDIANDGQVPTTLIKVVTSLDVSNQNIADLTGIQDFTELTNLNVETNVLTSLDLSSNVNLQNLNFDNNNITTLNLGSISKLVSIEGRYNQLSTIDLTQNPDLTFINLRDNLFTTVNVASNPLLETINLRACSNLTSIDISNNPNVKSLFFQDTALNGLDVSQNPLLETIVIERVNFNSIDVSNLSALTQLRIADNSFTSLDVSNNPALVRLECENNNLTYLNLKNGNNTNMPNTDFIATGNSTLTCILVDDATYSTTNWTNIDGTASFNDTYCRYTSIPDATFEARLEALGYDDISGDGQVPTALIETVTSLNVDDLGIDELTGIEDFTALVTLNARGNNLTTLDMSQNLLLEHLYINSNNLPSIDVSKNVLLRNLNIGSNSITTLDVSKNPDLRDLWVQGNGGLTTLDLSNNLEIRELYTYSSGVATLDLSIHSELRILSAYRTSLSSIDLSNNPELRALRVDETNVTALDLSNNTKLETLRINNTGIASLDLSNNTTFKQLWGHDTDLSYLNIKNGNNTNVSTFEIENNTNLTCVLVDDASYSTTNWTNIPTGLVFREVYCDYTAIPDANFEAALEALGYDDISGDGQVPTPLIEVVEDLTIVSKSIADITGIEDFKALKTLNCAGNTFTSLNLSNNTELTSVITKFTPIATLNISNSVNLDLLVCSFNNLTTLDVSNNIALTYLECNNNNLTALNISNNVALEDLRCGSNSLTAIDVTSNTALTSFWCQDNSITDLDLSNQAGLVSITVNNNSLTSLNVKNGNNTNVTNFIATGNINLTCINVDDVTYSTTNWLGVDDTANFNSSGCRYTQIPDANFEAELEALGYDDISGDGQVPTYLIEVVTSLALPNKGISDLTGIEDFVALTSLNCRLNNLTALDVTQNTLLKTLTADSNSINAIDLSNNTVLEILNLAGSNLTALDLTNNTSLRKLLVNGNGGLTSLDLSNNTKLVEFKAYSTNITSFNFSVHSDLETVECYGTPISSVNFSNNPELQVIRVENTNITELDLSNNPNIETLRVNDTGIQTLDLSKQTALKNLYAHDANLSYLNVKNGNNTNVSTFRAEGNPNLTCIVVDDVTYSTNNWTDIDGTASFTSSYCRYTAIPDANFEAALESLGYDDISGDGQVPTGLIEGITTLEVNNLSITDFTGIEDFVGLTHLDVGNNNAGSIDITNLVLLEFVRLDAMSLTSIDLSKNTALVDLRCSFNSGITSIDVSNNKLLETAHIGNNSLTSINLDNNTLLYELRMSHNNLTSVDLSKNTALTELNLSNNELSYLNLKNSNNTNIALINITSNPLLSCVLVDDANYSTTNWTDIDDATSFSDSYCRYTAIPDASFESRLNALGYDDVSGDGQVPTTLIENVTYLYVPVNAGSPITSLSGIEDFVSLERLICSGSRLTSIDLSNSPNLTEANLSNNLLTTISVNGLTALENLQLSGNSLSTIDVTTNTSLTILDLSGSDLTTLNVINNTALETLDIGNNEISTIDLSTNTLLESFTFSSTSVSSLDLSNNINLYYVEGEYADNLTELDLSALPLLDEVYLNDCALLTSINIKNGKNTDISDFETTGSPNLTCVVVDDATYSTTNWTSIDSQTKFNEVTCNTVQVAIKVYLQGAFINPNSGEESLMRDDLRIAGGVYGSTSPYSDSASISDAIKMDDAGTNSMVDWVCVELRDASDSSIIIAEKTGVLQRDGDIVNTTDNRISPLSFNVPSNNYYIVIKHRNHLGIMTASATSLSSSLTTLDLSSNSNLITGGSNALINMGGGIFAIPSGDFDENGQVQNIDTNSVIQLLGVSGYNKADLDMNGQVQNSDINNLLNPNIGKGEQF